MRVAKVLSLVIIFLSYASFAYAQELYTFTKIDYPGADSTMAISISGDNIAGLHEDGSYNLGFVYNISNSTYKTFDPPGNMWDALPSTFRISGNNIMGDYFDGSWIRWYVYNIPSSTYTTLNVPGTDLPTIAVDISGDNVVGYYSEPFGIPPAHYLRGFVYNIPSSTYTTLDIPCDCPTWTIAVAALGIDGNNIVGMYIDDQSVSHGFIYNGTYTTFDVPGVDLSSCTQMRMSGNNIVASCTDASLNEYTFLYNLSNSTYTLIDVPGSVPMPPGYATTEVGGISGNNIVGWYGDANGNYHGFVYNIPSSTYTPIDVPGAFMMTEAWGIDGNHIVGWYINSNGIHGFLATPAGTKLPSVSSLSPKSGTVGTEVTIKGKYFGSAQGSSTVSFNGIPVTTYTSWSDTAIKCIVPIGVLTGPVVVTTTVGASNGKSFTVKPPLISSLSPKSGTVGAEVTIKGKYFGSTQGSSTVSFNGIPVTTYTSWSDTAIKCIVPIGVLTGPVVVTTPVGASTGKTFTVK